MRERRCRRRERREIIYKIGRE